jgi:hypothetical protein
VLTRLGLGRHRFAAGVKPVASLSLDGDCEPIEKKPTASLNYEVKRGTTSAVYLKVMPTRLEPDNYAVLRVVARDGDKVTGGVTYVLINAGEK